ncbi:MAG: hypothetical protein ACREH3_05905 [Geminicoccales bacterium]
MSSSGGNSSTFRKLDKHTVNRVSRIMILSMGGGMGLSSLARSPVDWSRKRKAALIAFALIMAYLQSFYILGVYISDMEYWGTVWIGVTVEQRLLSFALGLLANFGLMAMPFLRAPGRILRTLLALSLSFGLLISAGWLSHDLWVLGLPDVGRTPSTQSAVIFLIDVLLYILPIMLRIAYFLVIFLNLWLLVSLAQISLTVRR